MTSVLTQKGNLDTDTDKHRGRDWSHAGILPEVRKRRGRILTRVSEGAWLFSLKNSEINVSF